MGALRAHAVKAAAAVAVAAGVAGLALTGHSSTELANTATYEAPPAVPGDEGYTGAGGCVGAADRDRQVVASAIGRGRVLFIGASYSIGLGATKPADHFTNRLAGLLHVPFHVDAVSGTGFFYPGPHDQGTFAQRIARDPVNPAPRLVLIQGGRDDAKWATQKQEYHAAYDTIKLAQKRFDRAQVVLLGPIPALLPVPPAMLHTRDAIAAAAKAAHAGFIDPIKENWITTANEHQFTGRIKGHPNNAGYAYITTRLLAELPTALNQAQPPLVRPPRGATPEQSTAPVTTANANNQPSCGDGTDRPTQGRSPAPLVQASLPADT